MHGGFGYSRRTGAEAARTSSAVCETECTPHTLACDFMLSLYAKHPRISFYMMRLIVDRLLQAQAEVST